MVYRIKKLSNSLFFKTKEQFISLFWPKVPEEQSIVRVKAWQLVWVYLGY